MDHYEQVDMFTKEINTLSENFQELLKNGRKNLEEIKLRYSDVMQRLEEKSISILEEIEQLNGEYLALEKQNNDEKHIVNVKENSLKRLTSDRTCLEKGLYKYHKERETIKKKGEPTQKDKLMLVKAKTKMSIFKETDARFDYTMPETDYIQGYIKSKNDSGVKLFKFKGNMKNDEISEKLWDQLTASMLEDDQK